MNLTCQLASFAVILLASACAQSSTAPSGLGSPASVAVKGTESCYPRPNAPCAVSLFAEVTDAAGRVLPASADFTYSWSGCATGTARAASCVLDRPLELTATVDVRALGWRAQGTRLVRGVNHAPAPTFSDTVWEWVSGNGFTLFAYSNDPDGPEPGGFGNCAGRRDVVAVGDCRFTATMCGGVTTGHVIDVDLGKMAPAGQCTATLTITDEWGASGSVTKSFSFPR